MQRIRMAGLALAAVFAFSAVASASASAELPEFSKTGVKFTATTGKAKLTSPGAGQTVECESSTTKEGAEINGVKTVAKVTVKFKGCVKGTAKCKTTGAEAGEIVTQELKGEIGYLNKTEKTVGTKLEPVTPSTFVTFTCEGGFETSVTGCVTGQNKPINEEVETSELIFAEEGGHQKFRGFEGATNCELKAFGAFASIESATATIKTPGVKEKIIA
jgi:hypothetical protein